MDTKLIRLVAAKATNDGHGTLSGYASTYTTDLVNERIVPGAFRNLATFKDKGFLTHNHEPVPIGWIDDAHEDAHGLYVTARWHGDAASQTVRQRVVERLAADRFVGMSIGYLVPPGGRRYADDGAVELTDVELLECAVAWIPANPAASVTAAKASARTVVPTDATVDLDRAFRGQRLLEQAAALGAEQALRQLAQAAELRRIGRRWGLL